MIGQYIQNYKIVSHLGEGGMGVVYKAIDNVLGREVALKMLHGSTTRQPQVLERFKKEAQVLARLLHPNIAVIYNFIEQDGQFFMVMEYVEGKNLDDIARANRTLPYKTIVALFVQALEGLNHAHRKGIFHRDIKPSNLILTPDGTVKLMDFGIAKIAGEQKLTQANRVVGTIEFMAPEIIEGKEPSAASDIYAAGVTMYELLTGKLPFANTSDYSLMQDILKKKPAPLTGLNAYVPPALAQIVMKALEKKPENRFRDAREFQQALLAAFPDCREIDPGILSRAARPSYETRLETTAGAESRPTVLAASLETRAEGVTGQAQAPQGFGALLRSKKTPFVLAGLGLVVLLAAIALLHARHSGPGPEELLAESRRADSLRNDSVKKAVAARMEQAQRSSSGGIDPAPVPAPVVQAPVIADEKPKTPADIPTKKNAEKKPAKKEAGRTVSPVIGPAEEAVPDKPVPAPAPEKKPEKKEIYLDAKLEVSLTMRESITRGDDREQPVSFVVNSPVTYQGVVIIGRGAIAKGTIRIGRVVSAVSINSVTAANGQEVELNGREHRKVKNLADDKGYTAFLPRGTRLSF